MDSFVTKSPGSIDEESLCDEFNKSLINKSPLCREIIAENLNLSYWENYLNRSLADKLLAYCEKTLTYFEGDLAKVRMFNKWHQIPRKQVAFGDKGMKYKFSGTEVESRDWPTVLCKLKELVSEAAQCEFNFVLVNRYADGNDYIAEHKDNEKDLDLSAPIASLSIGQSREFLLRHERRKNGDCNAPDNVRITLSHGSLLLMRPPTNSYWYHSLPKRKRSLGVRLNFTFRKLIV